MQAYKGRERRKERKGRGRVLYAREVHGRERARERGEREKEVARRVTEGVPVFMMTVHLVIAKSALFLVTAFLCRVRARAEGRKEGGK